MSNVHKEIIKTIFQEIKKQIHDSGGKTIVFKIYKNTPKLLYCYKTTNDEVYTNKETLKYNLTDELLYKTDFLEVFNRISKSLAEMCTIKTLLSKDQTYFRIRLDEERLLQGVCHKLFVVDEALTDVLGSFEKEQPNVCVPLPTYVDASQLYNPRVINKSKERKEMKDFSITNLKNALVNKITHLDKRTITILAIIALLLLALGKYQDIKDIAKGIKDKVTRSKNFKAMVTDAKNALTGLKKIIGIKGDNNEV